MLGGDRTAWRALQLGGTCVAYGLALALGAPAFAEEAPAGHHLRATGAQASSYLESNWNKHDENYHPNYLLDGNPKTAWVEGATGDGEQEWIQWPVSRIPSARTLTVRLRNGYQKSEALLRANAAPKEVLLQAWFDGELVAEGRYEVERAMGWQSLALPLGGKGIDRVRLQVVSAHPGAKYRDLCISDAEAWVDADVAYDEVYEHAKQAALETWIGHRVAQAAYFAELPAAYPFASTRFVPTTTPIPHGSAEAEALDARFAAHHQAGEPLRQGTSGYRLDLPKALQPPDGFSYHWISINEVMRWVAPDRTLFEATDAWHQVDYDRIGRIRLEGSPTQPTRAVFELSSQDSMMGRGFKEERGWWTLTFDEEGRLATASYAGQSLMEDPEAPPENTRLFLEVTWNDDSKVSAVDMIQGGRRIHLAPAP